MSFNTSVSTTSIDDLCKTTLMWVEQHCSLVDLRPGKNKILRNVRKKLSHRFYLFSISAVLRSLKDICTATDILNNPSNLPQEALAAVNQTGQAKSMK